MNNFKMFLSVGLCVALVSSSALAFFGNTDTWEGIVKQATQFLCDEPKESDLRVCCCKGFKKVEDLGKKIKKLHAKSSEKARRKVEEALLSGDFICVKEAGKVRISAKECRKLKKEAAKKA